MEILNLKLTLLSCIYNHKLYFDNNYHKNQTSGQYFKFIQIAIDLINLYAKGSIIFPNEADDPNIFIQNILEFLKKHKLPHNYSINNLKHGFGESVLKLLDSLADINLDPHLSAKLNNNFKSSTEDTFIYDQIVIKFDSESSQSSHFNTDTEINLEGNDHKTNATIAHCLNKFERNQDEFVVSLSKEYIKLENLVTKSLTNHSSLIAHMKAKEESLTEELDKNYPEYQKLIKLSKDVKKEVESETNIFHQKSHLHEKIEEDIKELKLEILEKLDYLSDTKELDRARKLVKSLHNQIRDMDQQIIFLANI